MMKQNIFKLGRFSIIYYIYECTDYIRREWSFGFKTYKKK